MSVSILFKCLVPLLLAAASLPPAAASPLTQSYSAATVFGFTTSGLYDANEPYVIGVTPWDSNLIPLRPAYTASFAGVAFGILEAAFPQQGGRTYQGAATELSAGSLVVRTYDALGTPEKLGTELHVEYKPGLGDPTDDIHWIQVIANNHKLGAGAAHAVEDFKVDIPAGQASPYYDIGYAANSRHFYDLPNRIDGDASHIWLAQLMLVSGPADGAGAITFLGGLNWGWENHAARFPVAGFVSATGRAFHAAVVPEPSTLASMLFGLMLLAVWLRRQHGALALRPRGRR